MHYLPDSLEQFQEHPRGLGRGHDRQEVRPHLAATPHLVHHLLHSYKLHREYNQDHCFVTVIENGNFINKANTVTTQGDT